MEQDRKALMRRFYEEVVGDGNVDLIDELLTDDFVEHEEFPGLPPTKAGVKQFFTLLKQAFPDVTMTPEHLITEGDLAVARVRMRGTHQGEFMASLPPEGRSTWLRSTSSASTTTVRPWSTGVSPT
jgi:predicted SnoaL-like aldol condensation-catalyzing enzyme